MSNDQSNERQMRAVLGDVVIKDRPAMDATETGFIPAGNIVLVDMGTRTGADGYFWLQHLQGWSPERSADDREVLLTAAMQSPLNSKKEAFPSAEVLNRAGGKANTGDFPLPDDDIAGVNRGAPRVTSLPRLKSLFSRLPVDIDQITMFQYFGNNTFAYTDGRKYNYDGYSQGLHGGLDLANKASNIPVRAGTECTYVGTYKNSPNRQVWAQAGDYTIIYQHITKPTSFSVGQAIHPDTVVAYIDPVWFHLHLEVRYKKDWIINPLWLMPDEMVALMVNKFKPNTPSSAGSPSTLKYFFKSGFWNQWLTPMEQPMIAHHGKLIGPTA